MGTTHSGLRVRLAIPHAVWREPHQITSACNSTHVLLTWLSAPQVSSVELERVVIASVPAVLEAAAVGVTPPGGGPEQLVMFLVLDSNHKAAAATHTSGACLARCMDLPSVSVLAVSTNPAYGSMTYYC